MDDMRIVEALYNASMLTDLDGKPDFSSCKKNYDKKENNFKPLMDKCIEDLGFDPETVRKEYEEYKRGK